MVGAYSRSARGLHFHKVVRLFCNKTINTNKLRDVPRQNLNMTLQLNFSDWIQHSWAHRLSDRDNEFRDHKPELERNDNQYSSWYSCGCTLLFSFGGKGRGMWALIRGWALVSVFQRTDWALIRGWAIIEQIRTNTISQSTIKVITAVICFNLFSRA